MVPQLIKSLRRSSIRIYAKQERALEIFLPYFGFIQSFKTQRCNFSQDWLSKVKMTSGNLAVVKNPLKGCKISKLKVCLHNNRLKIGNFRLYQIKQPSVCRGGFVLQYSIYYGETVVVFNKTNCTQLIVFSVRNLKSSVDGLGFLRFK